MYFELRDFTFELQESQSKKVVLSSSPDIIEVSNKRRIISENSKIDEIT